MGYIMRPICGSGNIANRSRVGGQVMGSLEIDGQFSAAVEGHAHPAVLSAGCGHDHLFCRPLARIDPAALTGQRGDPFGDVRGTVLGHSHHQQGTGPWRRLPKCPKEERLRLFFSPS